MQIYAAVFEAESADEPHPTAEATEVAFFGPDDLPSLTPGRVRRVPVVFRLLRGELPVPYVDLPDA